MAATQEDAALVMQLLQWGTAMGLEEAATALFAGAFDPEAASAGDAPVTTMLAFGETVATFVKHDVLDEGLARDLWWLDGVWGRVGPAARRERERLAEPRLYENFEALATKT
jgi:hypothetical protein